MDAVSREFRRWRRQAKCGMRNAECGADCRPAFRIQHSAFRISIIQPCVMVEVRQDLLDVDARFAEGERLREDRVVGAGTLAPGI